VGERRRRKKTLKRCWGGKKGEKGRKVSRTAGKAPVEKIKPSAPVKLRKKKKPAFRRR